MSILRFLVLLMSSGSGRQCAVACKWKAYRIVYFSRSFVGQRTQNCVARPGELEPVMWLLNYA